MATIKDIAKKLGIATSTVSKGLNGAKDISEETRQLVLRWDMPSNVSSAKGRTRSAF